jgi:hypothetical protein
MSEEEEEGEEEVRGEVVGGQEEVRGGWQDEETSDGSESSGE